MNRLTIILILFSISLFSQPADCVDGRYNNEIFDIQVDYEIEYGENINQTLLGADYTQTLYMDVYSPINDDLEDRPLIFFMFGGSFVGGSKSSPDIVSLCTNYAKMGYVAVAIDYRLSQNALFFAPNEENAYKAVLKAIHDVKAAIRYFRMNDELYNDYKIDTNRIYVGGVSAGAIAAINAAYLDEMSEIPSFLLDDYDGLGGFEGISGNAGYDSSFNGVINLCGAVGDDQWISEGDIPIVSIHGDQDTVVPYDDSLVTLFGLNIQVDGSYMIHQRMTELGNESDLYTYVNQGHTPFSNMNLETEFTRDFLYDFVCDSDFTSGDLNGDSNINVSDIVLLINLILSGDYLEPGDINSDGNINVQDVVLLVQIILNN